MKKYLSIFAGFGALLILAGAGCAVQNAAVDDQKTEQGESVENKVSSEGNEGVENEVEDGDDTSATKTVTETKPATIETAGKSMLTVAEVAKHNVPEDCYVIVRDSVYDVTKFTDKHPGGSDKIIPLCGKDATVPFTQVHDGQPKPENVLTGLRIGALQK